MKNLFRIGIGLLLAGTLITSYSDDSVVAMAGNAAGGDIVLTRIPCAPKDIKFHSDMAFYTTDADGNKRTTGCYGIIKSVLGPMIFIISGDNLRVYPVKAFHAPTKPTPKTPTIDKKDWL